MSLASRVFYSRLPLSAVRVRPGVGPEVLIGVSASQGMGLSIVSTLADLQFLIFRGIGPLPAVVRKRNNPTSREEIRADV